MATARSAYVDEKKSQKFVLCLKQVPKEMDSDFLLNNILSAFGKVKNVNIMAAQQQSGHNPFPLRFAECEDEKSMLDIIIGLQSSKCGIIASKKTEKSEPNHVNSPRMENSETNYSNMQMQYTNQNNNGFKNLMHNKFQENDMNRKTSVHPFLKNLKNMQENRTNLKNRLQKNPQHYINNNQTKNYEAEIPTNNNTNESENNLCNTASNLPVRLCWACGKFAELCCQRCEELYCSIECQDKDWQKHKYACFKKPPLVKIPGSVTESTSLISVMQNLSVNNKNFESTSELRMLPQQNSREVAPSTNLLQYPISAPKQVATKRNQHHLNINTRSSLNGGVKPDVKPEVKPDVKPQVKQERFRPSTGQQVVITHFDKTNVIHVRSFERREHEEYLHMLNYVISTASSSKPLTKMPKKMDNVLSEYENNWYRAVVKNVEDIFNIEVLYYDFGNVEIKKLSDLRELDTECLKLKRFVSYFTLKNVPDMQPNEKYKDFMTNLIETHTDFTISVASNGKEIELYDLERKSLNEQLLEMLSPKKVPTTVDFIKLNDLQTIKIPSSKNIEIVILDNSLIDVGIVSGVLPENIDKLEDFVNEMKAYCIENKNPYKPKEGEVCLAKVSELGESETWHRHLCNSQINANEFCLEGIDFGNWITLSSESIRAYPRQLLNIPCFTNKCYIRGFSRAIKNEISDNEKYKLGEIISLHDHLKAFKIDLIKDMNYITLPNYIIDKIKGIIDFDHDEQQIHLEY